MSSNGFVSAIQMTLNHDSDASFEFLGEAKKVNIDKDNTTIVEGKGNGKGILARVNEIKVQIEKSTSSFSS